MSEAAGCGNTPRLLTHSTSITAKEELAMNATPTTVHGVNTARWQGSPRQYQIAAREAWIEDQDRPLLPWTWISTTCDLIQCLDPDCMTVHMPIRIEYPRRICVYCGEGCEGMDHLLPEPWTGTAVRRMVAVVPACANCNSRIGDFPEPNIAIRRKRAQLSIERKNKHLLLRPHKTEADMVGLGYAMRSVAEGNNVKTARVRARLGWPLNPFYDLRAFQKSGIEDPESLGLCDEIATPLRPEYRDVA